MNNFLLLRLKTLLSILLLIDSGIFLNNWHSESILKYSVVRSRLTTSNQTFLFFLDNLEVSFQRILIILQEFFCNFALSCLLYLIVWNSIKWTAFLFFKIKMHNGLVKYLFLLILNKINVYLCAKYFSLWIHYWNLLQLHW